MFNNRLFIIKNVNYVFIKIHIISETITTTKTSVAEREIKAYLSQRRSVTTSSPVTFPPDAVDPGFEDEWNRFISDSSAPKFKYSIITVIIPIINWLKYYRNILLFTSGPARLRPLEPCIIFSFQ